MAQILVVDDEKSIRQTLTEFLHNAGHGVQMAEDADAALALLEQHAFDVIITDIILPRVTGIDLLRTIRALAPDVQVIVMTGEPTVDTAVEAVRLGAHDYLAKPVSKQMVVRAVERAAQVKSLLNEKRRLEEENLRYQKDLERLVDERTKALRESKEQAQLYLDIAGVMLLVLDAAGQIRLLNKRGHELLGYPEGALIGQNWFLTCLPVTAREPARTDFSSVMESKIEPTQWLENSVLTRLGEQRSIAWQHTLLRDAAGKIVGTLSSGEDITERTRIEEERTLLATAIEQAAETIVITDARGTILYANPAFERITGYTRQEALSQNPRLLKSGKHDAQFYRQMWETLQRGGIWSGHFINRRKDGTLYEEDATISPVRNRAGQIVNYVGIKHDVTRELQLEAQLNHAQKMEAIGRLAGGVAHDFNNILQAMFGHAHFLLERLTPGTEENEFAAEIHRGIERAASLTRQLLAFSRREIIDLKNIDLNVVVADLLKMLGRTIGEDIDLRFTPCIDSAVICADTGQIEQVLMNLCVNAMDAMPHGGILAIQTSRASFTPDYYKIHPEVAPGEYLGLTVADTGTGMDEETKLHAFEPFFTTKEADKGTGLGLATVYGIVRQHKGTVQIDSAPGKGTVVSVFLPAAAGPKTAVEEKRHVPSRRGTETILVAEDDQAIRRLAKMILEGAGYKILLARDGDEAIERGSQHLDEINIALLDIIMPKRSGRDVCEALRQLKPGLPVLFSTGYSNTGRNRTRFFLDSKIKLIQKPYTPSALLERIRSLLDENQSPPRPSKLRRTAAL